MKTLLASLSLLALAAHGAETPADGLYLTAPGAPAPQIRSQDGTMLFLAEKLELKMRDGRLQSLNNANTSFMLSIGVPYDPKLEANASVLMVGGIAYRQANSACSGQKPCFFRIQQDRNARQVAGYLGASITYFHHPGHLLRVSFTPTKPSFARGEDVAVILRIVNVGTEPIAFRNDLRECPHLRFERYAFSALKDGQPVPDVGNRPRPAPCLIVTTAPGPPTDIKLPPNATFEDTVNLSKWFGFKEPGAYKVRGSYPLQFLEPSGSTPPRSHIWDDFVTGEFTVTIE